MTKKQIAETRLAAREKRLRALAEVMRDCNDCVGDGGTFSITPAEHAEMCMHCMAVWALTGRYPRPER